MASRPPNIILDNRAFNNETKALTQAQWLSRLLLQMLPALIMTKMIQATD